ncbi:MAG: FlgD immunoglobulin-like domain containing protein [Eubacteriales bacterium]|nr:FlgD immunoglobulin-like domain containing protein [Eubacteriales bacterium]
MWKKWVKWVFFLCLLLLPSGSVEAASPKLSSRSITLTVGEKRTLKVQNTKANVSWSTSSKAIATVSTKGVVKGVKAGKATIKAKVSGKTLTCSVKVKNADANAVKISLANTTGGDFVKGVSKVTGTFMLDNTSTQVKAEFLNGNGKVVYTKTFAKCKENKFYSLKWDGKGKSGKYVSSGMYTLRITAGATKTSSDAVMFYTTKDFAGGDGSKKSPYLVKNLKQLNNVRKYNGRYFRQTANIDGDSANFTPLFSTDDGFTGVYDGGNKTIKNLYFRQSGNAGIFAAIAETGQVKNLKLSNFQFPMESSDGYIGGITAINCGKIYNCSTSGIVMNFHNATAGSLCGYNSGTIENCKASGSVIAGAGDDSMYDRFGMAGGIAGLQENGSIINCESISVQLFAWTSGGIVGQSKYSTINTCSLTGNCKLTNTIVGAIYGDGYWSSNTVTNCYTDTSYPLGGQG